MTRSLLLFLAASLQAAEPVQLYTLDGLWKVHRGDDSRWAAPGFDDSGWESRLPPFPGLGYVWYRRTITVPSALQGPISLWFPHLPTETEVYANGRLVLRYGEPGKWYTAREGPVPTIDLPDLKPGTVLSLALRVYVTTGSSTMFLKSFWQPPLLGSEPGIALAANQDHSERLRKQTAWLGTALLNLLFACGAFFIWRGQRDQPVYFWFAAVALTQFTYGTARFIVYCMDVPIVWLLPCDMFWGAEVAAWLFLFCGHAAWPGWRRFWPLPALTSVTGLHYLLSYMGIIEGVWIHPVMVPILLAIGFTAWRAVRKDVSKRLLFYSWLVYEAGQVAISVNNSWSVLAGRRSAPDVGLILIREPFEFDVMLAGAVLSVIAMGAILLARFTRVEKERQTYAGELEAARQVQELLVPAASVRIPGFEIESTYLPAQRVGGDFFQILPASDGAVVVIVGDVSGKGLRAAMVVSLVVGVLRNRRSDAPASILGEMNEALAGQMGGGFVTCCCARFDPDGRVTLANAGHPAPYFDSQEADVEAGLPLGIATGITYSDTTIAGGRFTLVSDGVVEAENARRELFGFERTREISTKPAREIAEAARAWGQNDDITVVTVRRSP